MIKEQYVSFEVAVLLKKKGFDMSSVYKGYNIFDGNHTQDSIEDFSRSEAPHLYVPTITQSLVMRWLREVYKYHIFIDYNDKLKWFCRIIPLEPDSTATYNNYGLLNSYEEATEIAIKYCLENLI